MKRAILCAALGASAFMSAATVAWAEDGQFRVALGDLNMTSSEGAKEALHRIEFSVGKFCEADAGRQPLERTGVVNHCVTDMTRKSVAQLNVPTVTALLDGQSQSGRPASNVTLAQK